MGEYEKILNTAYDLAISVHSGNDRNIDGISDNIKKDLDVIVERAESNKGIIAVLATLLAHKIKDPSQDIRYHQAQLENGFAGRTIDKDHITPWIKEHDFPAMAESGWLTRSLEQPAPYDLNYPGKITPQEVTPIVYLRFGHIQRADMSEAASLPVPTHHAMRGGRVYVGENGQQSCEHCRQRGEVQGQVRRRTVRLHITHDTLQRILRGKILSQQKTDTQGRRESRRRLCRPSGKKSAARHISSSPLSPPPPPRQWKIKSGE